MKLLSLSLLSFLFLVSCKKKQESLHPSVEGISESVYASGIIKSKNQYQVFSTVSGLISDIMVDEGDIIKKGAPLLTITNEASTLNMENSRLNAEFNDLNSNTDKLNQLKIKIDLAKNKMLNDSLLMMRQRKLWENKVGSLSQLEQRELAYKSSLNDYDATIVNYNDAKKQLSLASEQSKRNLAISKSLQNDFTIKSEFDGKIYSISKEKGEMVTPQIPVAIIGDSVNFVLELQVDEYDIAKVKMGQKVLLTLDSYKGMVFESVVSKINPIMNERSRTFTAEAAFIKRPEVLFPNLTVEANIIINTREKALTIPRNYLVDDNYVINENNEKVKVTIGLKDYQKAEILNGLTEKDVIFKPVK